MSDGVFELHEGHWRPSVPLPMFLLLHVRCHCGRRFWGLRTGIHSATAGRYERHYRLTHIPGGTP